MQMRSKGLSRLLAWTEKASIGRRAAILGAREIADGNHRSGSGMRLIGGGHCHVFAWFAVTKRNLLRSLFV
jgi:hypothetical protein